MRVYVCKGSSCKKHKKNRKKLGKALQGDADVEAVGCQKICKGLVVGVRMNGRAEWFRKFDVEGDLGRLRDVIRERDVAPLRDKWVKKRSGKVR